MTLCYESLCLQWPGEQLVQTLRDLKSPQKVLQWAARRQGASPQLPSLPDAAGGLVEVIDTGCSSNTKREGGWSGLHRQHGAYVGLCDMLAGRPHTEVTTHKVRIENHCVHRRLQDRVWRRYRSTA